jgi:hypothetical protein
MNGGDGVLPIEEGRESVKLKGVVVESSVDLIETCGYAVVMEFGAFWSAEAIIFKARGKGVCPSERVRDHSKRRSTMEDRE